MAQDQVEEVKQKTDIVSLISEFVELKKAGRNFKGLCPFHSEKTPSFMVSPELQIFKCFGCQEGGDALAFLQKYEAMEFYEALKFLADRAGIKLEQVGFKDRGIKQKLYEINSLASKFYRYILLKHPAGRPAVSYLTRQRGLNLDTIKKFQLGFSPDAPNVLKKFLSDKKGFKVAELGQAGITISANGRILDRFRGRVIFPLFDHRGNVTGFAGRILPKDEKKDLAKYINSPETPVYKKGNLLFGLNLTRGDIKKDDSAVVVEGELDMISSWQAGIKNTVAIKGSALTEDQVRLLGRFTKNLVLAPDSDLAGDAAARRGISVAQEAGLDIKVARLGDFKDPDEMARKEPLEFKKAIKASVGVWDFMIDSIFSKEGPDSGEGKARISREIVPILASIPDKIVQAHYVEVVAERLAVPVEAVVNQIEKMVKEKKEVQKRQEVGTVSPKKKSRRQLLEERLLTLAFALEAKILLKKGIFSLVKTPLAKRILEEYKTFSKKYREFNPSEFAAALAPELVDGFAEMVLADTQEMEKDPVAQKKELVLIIHELEILGTKGELSRLTKKIREFEEEKQAKNLIAVQKEFAELSQRLTALGEDETRTKIL